MLYTSIPKIVTFFSCAGAFFGPIITGTGNNLIPDKNSTGNLANNSHKKFWVSTFPFTQKWHHAYLQRAFTKAEVSLHIGYYLGFQPHLAQDRTIPHPNQNILTLNLTFSCINHNILAWATLYFAILHHCISSVLSCNQNTYFTQGPKSDYKHAYNHSLSNLLSCQPPFWSLSVFLFTKFPGLHPCPIASSKSAAHYLNFHQNTPL